MSAKLIAAQVTGAVIGVAGTGFIVNAIRKATLLGSKSVAVL